MDYPLDDDLSYKLNIQHHDTQGLAQDFQLRRHKHEHLADEGCREARRDWLTHIGPIHVAGCVNPWSGNFAAVTLPTCRPERLKIIAYIFEYAFLHDQVMESATKASEQDGDFASRSFVQEKAKKGSKIMQEKMVKELMRLDPKCASVCVQAWKEMVDTTSKRDKSVMFRSINEYLEYRMVDTGAPFVDKHMCFGMGIVLDEEELKEVREIARAAYAALGLCNDIFSFDIEFEDFQRTKKEAMTNIVWLFMRWHNLGVEEARKLATVEARMHELKFLRLWKEVEDTLSPKLERYVQGLAYQIAGNAAWSTDNPRYHPEKNVYKDSMIDFDRTLAYYSNANVVSPSEGRASADGETSSIYTKSSQNSPRMTSSRSSVSEDSVTNDEHQKHQTTTSDTLGIPHVHQASV